jgi:dephospho-CoA kinase
MGPSMITSSRDGCFDPPERPAYRARVRRIGLTGGIGTGKSTVARMLRDAGGWWIDADQLARRAVEPGTPGLRRVVDAFGPEVLNPDGELDRSSLGQKVFRDPEARERLNAIVHPEVRRLASEAFVEAERAGAPFVVYDVPLLFENDMEADFDTVAVVRASPPVQRRRVRERDGLSDEDVLARMAAQMPLEEKVRRADVVFDNDGSLQALRDQVESWLKASGLVPSADRRSAP